MRIRLYSLTAIVVTLAGCAHPRAPEPAPVPRITQLRVLPPVIEMAIGDSATLVGFVAADAAVTDRSVAWSSTDTLVASVDRRGRVVARALGIATIIASAVSDPTFRAISVIGVLTDEPPHVPAKKN